MTNTETIRIPNSICVRCSLPIDARFRPFCSERCSLLDLGSWLSESYKVPLENKEDG